MPRRGSHKQAELFVAATGKLVCGVDEAGRGPLAGAVFAAAVILDVARPISGLRDSKTLSAVRREGLALLIRENALAYAVAQASVEEIDSLNILNASLLAMRRAVAALNPQPDFARIDGNRLPRLPMAAEAIVSGDALVAEISAASILAKTERDAYMRDLHAKYPDYGFDRHMGYGTKAHLTALRLCGPTPVHRRSFAPVRACWETVLLP